MPGVERSRRSCASWSRASSSDAEHVSRSPALETLESGKPLAQSLAEIEGAADLWHYAATLARNLHGDSYNTLGENTLGVVLRDPVGVVSIITPWNFPFLIVSQKLPFALAAGCTTVVKPAEVTSGTTVMLGEILVAAGMPAGAVNIIVGRGSVVGDTLVTHPDVDMLSFTGSTAVGKQAVAKSAQTLKKVSMELGGKNPQIVFADCDWEAAVDATVYGIYFNAGQCCNSGSRVLVQASIAYKFAAAVVERSKLVKVGDPLVAGTQVGAITTDKQLDAILAHIEGARRAGATIALGGSRMDRTGMYVEPTVITGVTADMAVAREEVFGPVLSVLSFKDLDEAIALANSTLYGLSAAVWSCDFKHLPGGRAAHSRRHDLGQHVSRRTRRTAVRRLSRKRHRPRTGATGDGGLHRNQDPADAHRRAHRLVRPEVISHLPIHSGDIS